MSLAHDLIVDQLSPTLDGAPHLATWYTQGHADGLGDRLLMFDNTSAPSWEILRFRPSLARDERFEHGLRERVDRLVSFNHPAFPLIRPVRNLGHEEGLAVASTYAPGARLSDAMRRPRSAAFAVRLIRQLVPALAALQQHAPGIAHGVLDANRIVVTGHGRLTIREHMVGAAVANLELSSAQLWSEFGVLASPTHLTVPSLDSRSDVTQLGLVVLSLMAGHRIGPDEYPDKIEALLDEIAERNGRQALVIFQPLRYWLERALQLDEYMFESAQDANDALSELRDEPESPEDYLASLGPALSDADPLAAGEPQRPGRRGPRLIPKQSDAAGNAGLLAPVVLGRFSNADAEPTRSAADGTEQTPRSDGRAIRWAAAAAFALAIGEAAFIGRLLYAPGVIAMPAAPAARLDSPPPAPPLAHSGPTIVETSAAPRVETASDKLAAAVPAGTAIQRGAFRLAAAVELHVLDGERLLGSSADGPIVAPAGRRQLEFVNSAIGYRERRVVEVKAGQITTLSITIPNGSLNINAVPWASVWIDGNSYGETPLGNLSVTPGEHEIVFRHPQFGERRQKTLVRADTPARVTVSFQQ